MAQASAKETEEKLTRKALTNNISTLKAKYRKRIKVLEDEQTSLKSQLSESRSAPVKRKRKTVEEEDLSLDESEKGSEWDPSSSDGVQPDP
jgi:hypothetical protein